MKRSAIAGVRHRLADGRRDGRRQVGVEDARDDVVGVPLVVGRRRRPARTPRRAAPTRGIAWLWASSRPRNTPGKASTLLIWLGKSLRPVATTAAWRRAIVGSISGSGLARANTIARGAIDATSCLGQDVGRGHPDEHVGVLAARAPSGPLSPRRLVSLGDPGQRRRRGRRARCARCHRRRRPRRRWRRRPAAGRGSRCRPHPLRTGRCARPSSFLSTTRSALVRAPSTTIAVPCWSSWNTGMSSSSRSRRSISKQRGAAMSSRLMPPNTGRQDLHGADDLLGVLGGEADREGVDPGEPLEQRRLALHHRQRRRGPDVAEPEHGRTVGDDSDRVALDRQPAHVLGALGDRSADSRHPRRVRHRQVVAVAQREPSTRHLDLAAEVQQERAVGHLADRARLRRQRSASVIRSAWSASGAATSGRPAVGRHAPRVTSNAVTMPPADSTADVSWLGRQPVRWDLQPDGDRVRRARDDAHATQTT